MILNVSLQIVRLLPNSKEVNWINVTQNSVVVLKYWDCCMSSGCRDETLESYIYYKYLRDFDAGSYYHSARPALR